MRRLWYTIAITLGGANNGYPNLFSVWNELNANEQQALSANVRELHYHKGDLIHTGGDCMGLVLVASGQLRAYTISEDGREITMYRLFERDICLFLLLA